MTLWADQNISGVPYAGHEYKLNLFADDALLTLTSPLTTLFKLSRFSSILGLHINLDRTVALYVTVPLDLVVRLQFHFPFHWKGQVKLHDASRILLLAIALFKSVQR